MKKHYFFSLKYIVCLLLSLPCLEGVAQTIYNAEAQVGTNNYVINPLHLQQKYYFNSIGEKVYFLLYQPETPQPGKKYKLILYFAHAGQPSNTNVNELSKVAASSLMRVINENSWAPGNGFQNQDFVVIAPQPCYSPSYQPSGNFSPELTDETIDMALFNYQIDEDRIYLWGGSQGAIGLNNFVGGSYGNTGSTNTCRSRRVAAVYENLSEGGNLTPSHICQTWVANHVALWEQSTPGDDGAGLLSSIINSCPGKEFPVPIISSSMFDVGHAFYGAYPLAKGYKISKEVPNPVPNYYPPAGPSLARNDWFYKRDTVNTKVGVKTQNYWNPGVASVPDFDPPALIDIFSWFSLQSKSLILNNQNFIYPDPNLPNVYTQGSDIKKYNTITVNDISNFQASVVARKAITINNSTILPGTTLIIDDYCTGGVYFPPQREGEQDISNLDLAGNSNKLLKNNPAENVVHFNKVLDEASLISIFNSQGRVVKELELQSGESEFGVSDLKDGVYIIRISTNTESLSEKLIIVK